MVVAAPLITGTAIGLILMAVRIVPMAVAAEKTAALHAGDRWADATMSAAMAPSPVTDHWAGLALADAVALVAARLTIPGTYSSCP
jgi:hypothetical protein